MDNIVNSLEEVKIINHTYDISNDAINQCLEEIKNAKVCTPIIGKFSSGKSALVNTILGYSRKILKEDITPETAIPAEIVYSDTEDSITMIKNDGSYNSIAVNDYRNYIADATTVKCARIQLRNSILKEIPDVMVVDMPGFESGFEIHNKAIDNYLPRSQAYIVAFPADDMIVRSSVGNILRELCIYDTPLCVVITKYDKRNHDFDVTFNKMKESLKRFVGEREIYYCRTSSFTGDAEELENFLKMIQKQSKKILAKKYSIPTLNVLDVTENYLKATIANSQLSESELEEEDSRLQKQLTDFDAKISKEQGSFDMELVECIEAIKSDVQQVLHAEESTLVAMALNKQNINEHLNHLVRSTVAVSVKKKFIPKVEQYMKKISNCFQDEFLGNLHLTFHFDSNMLDKSITSSIVAVIASLVLGTPILAIITAIFIKLSGDRKREKAKQDILMKLRSEVFPHILNEVGKGLEQTIAKQITILNTSIQEEIRTQREILEKSMADLRARIHDENSRKENDIIRMKADLERIGEIRDGLR